MNVKSLNYLVQNYVYVAEVAKYQIGQNMTLSLHDGFCFKFIIVLRTLLFSVETYIDILILLCYYATDNSLISRKLSRANTSTEK